MHVQCYVQLRVHAYTMLCTITCTCMQVLIVHVHVFKQLVSHQPCSSGNTVTSNPVPIVYVLPLPV